MKLQDLKKKQEKYNQKLHTKVYSLMEKYSKNPSNANKYFEEVMIEFDNQRNKVRKETAECVLEAMTGERRIAFHEGEYNERIAEEKQTAVEILKDIN